jgi:hypothetical protein
MISLLAGKPNPETFPITSLSFTARTPSADGTDPERELTLKHQDLEEALQYGPTPGLPRLIKWLLGLQEEVHERLLGEDWTLTCGAGGQDLLYKVGSFLLQRGESLSYNAGDICFGGTWRFCFGRSSSLWVGAQLGLQCNATDFVWQGCYSVVLGTEVCSHRYVQWKAMIF